MRLTPVVTTLAGRTSGAFTYVVLGTFALVSATGAFFQGTKYEKTVPAAISGIFLLLVLIYGIVG